MNITTATHPFAASVAGGISIVAATIASASYLYFKQIEPIKIISTYLLISIVSEAIYSFVIKNERWFLPYFEKGKETVVHTFGSVWHYTNTNNLLISGVYAIALGLVASFCRVTARQATSLIFAAAILRLIGKLTIYGISNKDVSENFIASLAVAYSEVYGFIIPAISTISISILMICGKV